MDGNMSSSTGEQAIRIALDRRWLIPLRIPILLAAACGSIAWAAANQDGVVSALKAKYALTQTTLDRTQISQPGTVMQILKTGINAQPWDTPVTFENPVVDGVVQQRSLWVSMAKTTEAKLGKGKDLLILKPGDKVYITKIESKTEFRDDQLKIAILSCDALDVDGGASQKRYAATLSFKFPKNTLAEAAPDQVEQTVEAVLAPEDAGGNNDTAASAPAGKPRAAATAYAPPASPAPPAPVAPTQNIAIGQTIQQVVAIMGQPKQIVDLGAKKTYTYPDLKIVFVNGKVSDVQ
jgi:hypothetical protein